jgi:hypothetical protein
VTALRAALRDRHERGVALLAVLFALTLLMLLTLPFAVSMSVGADAAQRDVEEASVQIASASVRDILLTDAAVSHPALDATPMYDGLEEFPPGIELPPAFAGIADGGRVLLGGEVVDLQRYIPLDAASPLVFANAIGVTTRLREELKENDSEAKLEDASALPDAGFVWIAGELLKYAERDGNTLRGVVRGFLFPEFADGKATIEPGALVLDFRTAIAAAWPFLADPARKTRRAYRTVGEVFECAKAGYGSFTAAEIDALRRVFAVDTMAADAAVWGKPERVFNDVVAGETKVLTVKAALHVGAGSTVRLRNQRSGAVEYALVMATGNPTGTQDFTFPVFQLQLLHRVLGAFPQVDTVIEPLIPAPVNVNTASVEVLTTLFAELRQGADVRVHEGEQRRQSSPRRLSVAEARQLAEEIATMRRVGDHRLQGPFQGWKDLVTRVWKPRFEAGKSPAEVTLWVALYRNLQSGRDNTVEMGTAPVCFRSGPWVRYRGAASRSPQLIAPGVVGRHERSGIASVMPGCVLTQAWNTQERYEDAFLLDRRAPFWTTFPVNVGALLPVAPGNDPAPRYFPHLAAIAFPGGAFGEQRFPATDEADAGIQPAPATAVSAQWPGSAAARGTWTFSEALDVRGRDVKKEGPFLLVNTGPQAGSGQNQAIGAQPQAQPAQRSRRHDQLEFPFSNANGFVDRFGVSFWVEAQALENAVLFDHADSDPDRNRLCVQSRDGKLVFEVIDEAGIDPNPSASPAGIERTASEWSIPLPELALPANTPLHVSVSAPSGRPADMTVALDGMTRGKPRYVTFLTAAVPVFDPQLANNQTLPNAPGNERFLDLTVDSTEGFPPAGIVRVGLELFEYSEIQGNTFRCRWRDSMGGRGARQGGHENIPAIPTDASGRPTINLNDPRFQNLNLAVFPEHPVGSQVELYGYSAVLSEDSPMMVESTTLEGAIGGFAVARGFIDNPRPIAITPLQGAPIPIGAGIDASWTGDLLLADPVPTGTTQPPPKASDDILRAFPESGGYVLLVQVLRNWSDQNNSSTPTVSTGGIEMLRYTRRDGHKLTSVQRAQRLRAPAVQREYHDGTARQFVTDFQFNGFQPPNQQIKFNDMPTWITWVVPVSLPVRNTACLWDPAKMQLTEWLQIYPQGGDSSDTEWVRYDTIAQQHVVRGVDAAWLQAYFALTLEFTIDTIQLPAGAVANRGPTTAPPWNAVAATVAPLHIGYIPKLESTWPQIHAARRALGFRGDADTGTSSHAHSNPMVMACHRLQLQWGNHGAYNGRVGRNDRVALVQGSQASGTARPGVEWHTVNWQMRRFDADNNQRGQTPPERLGPWPFQLVAFQAPVKQLMLGPPANTVVDDPRRFDRVVKFPSGELPAAWCEKPTLGAAVGNRQQVEGYVDEFEIVAHFATDLLLDEEFTDKGDTFVVSKGLYLTGNGWLSLQNDLSAAFPVAGGLVAIDGEILAYQSHADGSFRVATNGRGLLGTEVRGHDRGARVRFLTHRPAAILANAVGVRDSELALASKGALPDRYGTVLLGRELLHYTWRRNRGEQTVLEMPRFQPPSDDPDQQPRGLFRGRYGTAPQAASAGEVVIGFPFRYWDRHVERSDDPELAHFQLTMTEAPVFFRSLRWRQETKDPRVEVVCSVRADGKLPWDNAPLPAGGLWQFRGAPADTTPYRLAHHAARLEIRFATAYRPGCLDLETFRAHGWKTTARVEDVRVQYEGQSRIHDEQVTAR